MTLTGIAKRVHDDMMGLDPEAAVEYARIVVLGGLQHDLETHGTLLQHRVNQVVNKRLATVKGAVRKTAIAKNRDGQGVDHLLAVADVISKADFFNGVSDDQRREWARRQERDASGRFRTMHRKIDYSRAEEHGKIKGRLAAQLGIPQEQADKLTGADRAHYQDAYLQVSNMLKQYAELPEGEGMLRSVYEDANGKQKIELVALNTRNPGLSAEKFKDGGKLVQASVITDGGLSVGGAAFNLVGALGGTPYMAGRGAAFVGENEAGVSDAATSLGAFSDDWLKPGQDENPNNPSEQIFRRVGAGSKLLASILGPNVSPQAKLALTVGRHVAQYGPEAQQVIGPHADRAAYRYRGVERTPDRLLQSSINVSLRQAQDNDTGPESARNGLLYGKHEPASGRTGARLEHIESPIVDYFKTRLADKDLVHLQRKSGVIPPSEGAIIDRNGKVVTQAVGYGDDWYLPFNLKTLSKLKGGDYIRTRVWGGPTTEDIYTGLVSGARSVSVVSNNGTYVIEFDPAFRGSRRYSDKALRMTKRYGHLLDAVKSEQVRLSEIPPERLKELREKAVAEAGDPTDRSDRAAFRTRYDELLDDERTDPQLSQSQKDELAETFLTAKAQHMKTRDGYAGDWTALAAKYVTDTTALHADQIKILYPDIDATGEAAKMRVMAHNAVADPTKAIATLGFQDEFDQVLERATQDERTKRSPLKLDGEGYKKALDALKEQFPYYIANVDYRPTARGTTDVGYIKPRFSRPEKAKAGYYDATITGAGKVTADQTRYQNAGVDYRAAKATMKRVPEQDKAPEASGGSGTSSAPKAATDDDKIAAYKALYDSIAEAKTYGSAGHNAPIDRATAMQTSRAKVLAPFFQKPWEDWHDEILDDMRNGEKLAVAAEALHRGNVIDEGKAELRAVRDPAKAALGMEWHVDRAAAKPDRDYDFGFASDEKDGYYDGKIDRLASHLGVNAEVTDGALNDLIAHNHDLYQKAQRYNKGQAAKFETAVKNAVQIKQLRRMKDKAQVAAAAKQELKDAQVREQTKFVIAGVDDNELPDDVRDGWRKAHGGDKTISGELEE